MLTPFNGKVPVTEMGSPEDWPPPVREAAAVTEQE